MPGPPSDTPAWARADPLMAYLMSAGLSLEEAYEKAERAALIDEAPDLPPPRSQMVSGDRHFLAAAMRAWNPADGPPPVGQYP